MAESARFVDRLGARIAAQHADHHHGQLAFARPALAGPDQGAPDSLPARLLDDKELGDIAVRAEVLDDIDIVRFLVRDAPAERRAVRAFGDENFAVMRRDVGEQPVQMLLGDRRIEPAVGLDRMLIVLRPHDEGAESGPVLGQPRRADAEARHGGGRYATVANAATARRAIDR